MGEKMDLKVINSQFWSFYAPLFTSDQSADSLVNDSFYSALCLFCPQTPMRQTYNNQDFMWGEYDVVL